MMFILALFSQYYSLQAPSVVCVAYCLTAWFVMKCLALKSIVSNSTNSLTDEDVSHAAVTPSPPAINYTGTESTFRQTQSFNLNSI